MNTKLSVRVPVLFAALLMLLCLLPATAHATSLDTWLEKAKATANTADHVIGPGGNITTNNYTVIMPGETIGVCPDASMSDPKGPFYAVGPYATIDYTITQFDNPIADYTYLPRSKHPDATLTEVKTETVTVPYTDYGAIADWKDGEAKLLGFEYVSIYRNDTGLPILITHKGRGETVRTVQGAHAYPEHTPPNYIQAKVTWVDHVTLSFLEPSYQITLAPTPVEATSRKALEGEEMYWNHTSTTVPASFPKSYIYASDQWQTFKFPSPIVKGHAFAQWHTVFINEYDYESNHPIGAPLRNYTQEGYKVTSDDESTTYEINFHMAQNKSWSSHVLARDINPTAEFEKSAYTHTIGFNGEGGTVNGASYYICEDYMFRLDVNTIKPVRAGYTFQGWSTKAGSAADIITDSGTGDNVYGTTADNNHTELYAVWSGSSPQPAQDGIWERVAGKNAYGTMEAIANKGWQQSETVVLATFNGYWDALSASSLAGLYQAPILLTGADSLKDVTKAQIERLGAKRVILVGGTGAISDKVKTTLEGMKLAVERVAGKNSQLTALEVAKALGNNMSKTCIIATSNGFWDALAASPFAYRYKAPIYLTRGDGTLRSDVLDAIKAAGFDRAVIVGGSGAVSASTEKALSGIGIATVERKSGKNSIATSLDFATWAIGQGMSANGMAVATVSGFYDALTGGPLCGKAGGVLVLASNGNTSNTSLSASHAQQIENAYILGGTGALSDEVLAAFEASTARLANKQVQAAANLLA